MLKRCLAPVSAAVICTALTLLLIPPSAAAATNILGRGQLEASVTSAACTITWPDGAITDVACSPTGWSPTLTPGSSASMTATVDYHYEDNGLPLPIPQSLQVTDRASVGATFESAVLYVETSHFDACRFGTAPHCSTDIFPYDHYFDRDPQWVVFLSNNDHPESVNGQVTVTTEWEWLLPTGYSGPRAPQTINLHVSTWGIAYAVPEPSTWVLMLGSLTMLIWRVRRRPDMQGARGRETLP
jgi:hypothetical protein